jgi:hypothetical protein
MIAERAYAALLHLYPRGFREEYGPEMLAAFREMRQARKSAWLRFWAFVATDTARAVALERLDGLRGTAVALFGLLVTVATAHTATYLFHYFYHPYFEGTVIPALPYGVALGLVLGISVAAAQWLLFPAAERRAGRLALASAVAIPIAILFCGTAVEQAMDGLTPLAAQSHPRLLDVLVLGLGRPNTWIDVATQFSAMAASALAVRAIARPEGRAYAWNRGRHVD